MIGREMAGEIRDLHRTSEPEEVADKEELAVAVSDRWPSRHHEMAVEGLILIPKGLTVPRRRTHIAHALGHHFMHAGNQSWIRKHDHIWDAKLEHQAKEFAAWLTIPYIEEDEMEMSDAQVGAVYQVEEDLVRIRRS